MSKVIELRKFLKTYLKTIHPRVFFQRVPDNVVFPYLTLDLPNSSDDGSMERFILDIDGWDISTDTTAIETLMDSVDKGLHRKTVVLENVSATFYRENRLPLLDDNPQIQRRKYIYQVRTFE